MTHKRLSELHPADVADILEQLDPKQRALVFDHLDKQQAAETFSELEDEYQTDMIGGLTEHEAAGLLAQMDPDDAADILGDLPYEKAEKLLWLMGVMLTAQFVNGVLLPVLLVFLVRIINDRRVMGIYRNRRLANALSYLTIAVVAVLSAVLLVMQVFGIG